MLLSPAVAIASSGQRSGPSIVPLPKADAGSVTYSDFFGGSCNDAGFSVQATARITLNGPYQIQGRTTLDGTPFDTYNDVDVGPDQFPVTFVRTFTPPPPATSTYEFVFHSDFLQNGTLVGRTLTTVRCQATVLQASSRWSPAHAEVPVGGPAVLAGLAAALAFAGYARLRTRPA